jgi:probable F420-dependent oxidoreductase
MARPQLSVMLVTFAVAESVDWTPMVDFARAADQAGIDRLALSDHVVFGENLEAYGDPSLGGSRGSRQPTGPDGSWLEPLTTIAFLSGVTTRVRFSTGILLAALRRPVVLAKMAATIDVLSEGRLDLGVGIGWQREEYEAAGLAFSERGALLDRTLDVCQRLWRERRVDYSSDDLSFTGVHQMPKPLHPDGVPLWISGTVNPRVMDRLARYGAGWIPWGEDATDVATGITKMRAAMEDRDRDPSDIGVVGSLRLAHSPDGSIDATRSMAPVSDLRSAGVTDFRIFVDRSGGESKAEDVLGQVRAAFDSAVG